MINWHEALSQWGEIQHNAPLAKRTTMGVGGAARCLFAPYDIAGLAQAMLHIPADMPLLPLGRGSNLLVADEGFEGLVLDVGRLQTYDHDVMTMRAGAGMRMSKLAQKAAQAGLTGIEFMATVPGDIGGGVAMNAGAFGQQVSDCLQQVQLVLRTGQIQTLDAQSLQMCYRSSVLPAGSIVVKADFNLQAGEREAIYERMRMMRQKRRDTQPLEQPNCGSVFKNPTGNYAARLIEHVGLKGHRIGQAQISSRHANFIVNHGQACTKDVLALIRLAQQRVAAVYAIDLETEVCMLGMQS
ncbi:MAG: UDP-N-acetylmuramate dehydrogenase [Mariprofundaceae bacterium]|nr:UDP-N-acetylmuramate dehydrogenase [Mariprofundaceae bacterium]